MEPSGASPHDPRAIEALLAFWAEAGVDACLLEAPVDRLSPPPPPAAAPAPAPRAPATSPALEATGGSDRAREAAELAAGCADLPALLAAAERLFPGGAAGSLALESATAHARLMVVGDAPCPEDLREGRPFRGSRGALVRALLDAAGLTGAGVLYAHTAFARPRGGGDPSAEAQAEAAPFLARAAALASPAAVLLLGGCPVRALAGAEGPILKLRGRWLRWRAPGLADPLPALATLGPDFLLRHPAAKKHAWADVLSLAARLDPVNTCD